MTVPFQAVCGSKFIEFRDDVGNPVPALERELEVPKYNFEARVYRPSGTEVFLPALSSTVVTNSPPQVGVVRVT